MIDKYAMRKRQNIVLVLEELDFSWDSKELQKLVKLYEEGKSIAEMNEVFHRLDTDEIFIALFHLARKGKIKYLDLGRLKE
ncbi:hypothetical protein B4065_0133 [Caldibacillus thermoamylovorans]|uniref:hypothetical protein n=1 Tax=Caldibacillus thermoamylovorans TaxID=35841 RepID=UPI0005A42BFB|nr:hypothetical protein [Caldibacillus thermoamylovorans]KIO60207.1 hypothetical protein B4065_0133 [Caldibacillus thermoamylovorans]